MSFKVRTPLWFTGLLVGGFVLFAAVSAFMYAGSGDHAMVIFVVWPCLGIVLAVVFRNLAVLKIEPHRIVSRLANSVVTTELRDGDRLEARDGQLFVVRPSGGREHVRVNARLLRKSDWFELLAAVESR